jgi:diacylglycerol O-acyltransferase / wax synthase
VIRRKRGPPTLGGQPRGLDARAVRADDGGIDRARPDDLLELAVDCGGVPWQVGALLVLDRPLDKARLRAALAQRIQAVPRLRRRLVPTPPLCGRPIWVDDPEFAVNQHIREVHYPGPGDEAALWEVAVKAVGTRLPLNRPPWAAVSVTDLNDGRGALLVGSTTCSPMALAVSPSWPS